jgi:hypothetical protein
VLDLEPDSQWLLPVLYANLRGAGVPEARLGRYAYVYRHNWYKNQLLLAAARPLIETLQSAPTSVLVLGEAALALAVYARLGARPVETIVIGCAGKDEALLLAAEGWERRALGPSDTELEWTHAQGWRLGLRTTYLSDELLAETQMVRCAGQAWRVPSTRDQLILVLLERNYGERRSALLWAVDAVHCLRRLGPTSRISLFQRAAVIGQTEAAVEQALTRLASDFGLGDVMARYIT